MNRIKSAIDLLKELDKSENGVLTVYAPYHRLFWDVYGLKYNYISYITNNSFNPYYIADLFSSDPFKIVKLELSYKVKTPEQIIVKASKDTKDKYNLGAFLYTMYLGWQARTKEGLKDRLNSILNNFYPLQPHDENNVFWVAADSIKFDYYNAQRSDTFLYNRPTSLLTHTETPLYLSYEDAMAATIAEVKLKLNATANYVNKLSAKFLMPQANKKVKILNGHLDVDPKNKIDYLLFRKTILTAAKRLNVMYQNFNNELKKNNEIKFDYKTWNSIIYDIIQFRAYNPRNERVKHFKLKNRKYATVKYR